jgi:hypothetical protein
VQSVAQIAFQNAILKIESKKRRARLSRPFLFSRFEASMGTRTKQAAPPEDLSELRRKITELVAQNAVPMVQEAIDAVREEGQYQAMKYLFEMVGLYPAIAQEDSASQESLAQILLDQLGLTHIQPDKHASHSRTEVTDRNPVK